MNNRLTRYAPEVRERAVRMVLDRQGEHSSQWAAITSVAGKTGCKAETLRTWVRRPSATAAAARADERRAGADQSPGARGARAAPGQRDPAQGVGVFCPGGARPPIQVLKDFIDRNRVAYGVEPICRMLPIAPSTYYEHAGLQGVVRGKPRKWIGQERMEATPMDRVKRQFSAERPDALWVSAYVPTWQGFVDVAFVIDGLARRIVGWRVRSSQQTPFVLDALEQAVWARRPRENALIHHSDRGSQ